MNKKGSITILFAILLPALLLFGMFIFEALWEGLAMTYMDQACYSAARSSLADYDSEAWQDYGVFLFPGEPDEKRLEKDLARNLDTNGWLAMEVTRIESSAIKPLRRDVLKNQILENVKYIAPVRGAQALWDLISHEESAESFKKAGVAAEELEKAHDNMEKTSKNNRRIKDYKSDIRGLRSSIKEEEKKEVPDSNRISSLERKIRSKDRDIDDMYDENRKLSYETQEILNKLHVREVPPKADEEKMAEDSGLEEELDKLSKAKKITEERLGWEEDENEDNGFLFSKKTDVEDSENTLDLVQSVQDVLESGRNRLYLGEYALKYFSNVNSDSHEAQIEYLITGSRFAGPAYAARLLGERVALNALGYFALDPKAPPEILSRTIYSLVLGGIQGLIDLYTMVGLEKKVPIIHITPGETNPFKRIEFDYEDHQRLDLLLTGEKKKLDRIQKLLPAEGYTGRKILFEARVRRIFPFQIIPNDIAEDDPNYLYLRKEISVCY